MGDDIIERVSARTWARTGGRRRGGDGVRGRGDAGSVLEAQLDIEEAHFVRPDFGVRLPAPAPESHALDNVRSEKLVMSFEAFEASSTSMLRMVAGSGLVFVS